MGQRLKAGERRESVLQVMREMHAGAKSQEDFTAAKVAGRAGISVVWLYRLAGEEFRELRAQLEGSRRPKESVIKKLKRQISSLRREVRELKAKLKAAAREQIIEAIRTIELLDAENRMLRAEVKTLREQLAECEVITYSAYAEDQPNIQH